MTDQRTLHSDSSADLSPGTDDIWRNEIQARVAGYRTRRGRRVEGAFSMRFPFPPPEHDGSDPIAARADSSSAEQLVAATRESAAEDIPVEVVTSSICDVTVAVPTQELEVSAPRPEVSPAAAPASEELCSQPPTPPDALVEIDREPSPPPLPELETGNPIFVVVVRSAGGQEWQRSVKDRATQRPGLRSAVKQIHQLPDGAGECRCLSPICCLLR